MYKKIWEEIINSNNIVLISHVNPDGDALGSSLSMYSILKKLNKNVSIVNMTELPDYLDFLPFYDKVKNKLPSKIDLMISFDCGSFDRLGIEEKNFKLINIDHHISNTKYGEYNLIESDAASSSQVVYNLLKANNIEIDKESAICIYTALVTDTGNFQYESVNDKVFEMAADLVRCGVEVNEISKMLYEREKLSRLRLTQMILETLELFLEGRVGVVEVTKKMYQESGANKSDSDGVVNMVRKLATVEVAVLLREEDDGIKISLRSKNYVDVSEIAASFGGGGHKRASGFFIEDKDFKKVRDIVLDVLKGKINE